MLTFCRFFNRYGGRTIISELTIPLFILCGGMAKRLGKISSTVPKILIDINGKSFIEIQLNHYAEKGVRNFMYLTSHLNKHIDLSTHEFLMEHLIQIYHHFI